MARFAEILRRYMWVANALGVLLLASFLANMVSIGIQSKILSLPPIAKTPLDGDGVATEAFRPDLAYYNVITDRDLFGSHATAGEGLQQVPLEPIKVSTLRIQLVGTLEGPPFYARAVIRDQGTGEVNIYRIGDMIQGQAKLILVDRARIVIERNGQQEEVVIYENEAQGAPAAPPPQPAAPPTMGGPPGPPPPGGALPPGPGGLPQPVRAGPQRGRRGHGEHGAAHDPGQGHPEPRHE